MPHSRIRSCVTLHFWQRSLTFSSSLPRLVFRFLRFRTSHPHCLIGLLSFNCGLEAMAATRGSSLLRLLHQSAVAQAARYQPAGAQLSAPAFATSPAQSILRRLFADGTQTIDRASVEAGDVAQKGKEYAQDKTEQAKDTAGSVADKAKDTAGSVTEKAKDTASNVTDEVKDAASSATEKTKETARSTSEKAQDTAADAKEKGATVVEKVKQQAGKEINTAEDMVKDVPQKTKETAQNIKEVGIEAAKAVKRDASKIAEKIGLKTPSK